MMTTKFVSESMTKLDSSADGRPRGGTLRRHALLLLFQRLSSTGVIRLMHVGHINRELTQPLADVDRFIPPFVFDRKTNRLPGLDWQNLALLHDDGSYAGRWREAVPQQTVDTGS